MNCKYFLKVYLGFLISFGIALSGVLFYIDSDTNTTPYMAMRYTLLKGNIEKASYVNAYVNSIITYQSETGEDWQSPQATYRLRTGDCEDFATLKVALLEQYGVRQEELAIAVLFFPLKAPPDKPQFAGHAVALVKDVKINKWIVLDLDRAYLVPLDDYLTRTGGLLLSVHLRHSYYSHPTMKRISNRFNDLYQNTMRKYDHNE
jgi:hypothetical protein